ncbi:MAG: DUF6485 family protein [Eubacteriales bacterium]
MIINDNFCTCKDMDCKLNPCNHELGCTPCIQKNLKNGEMPSCFFNLVNDDLSDVHEFTIDSFVRFYIKNKKD